MIRICTYCEVEGRPAVLGEKPPLKDPSRTHGICAAHYAMVGDPALERAWFARWRAGEQVTVTWTRPDGTEAVTVQRSYQTPQQASTVADQLCQVLADRERRKRVG